MYIAKENVMPGKRTIPSFRPSTIILVALSLSIGWGIRGNFGHEAGAMLAGTLAGIAVALFSGREDWRSRVMYFAFFGALGWGFGGSISYMVPFSYAECGHLPSQVFGWFGVFLVGFLWAGMGGAGTAFAATADRENLTAIFRPLCWVFAFWTVQYFCEDAMIKAYEAWFRAADSDTTWLRHLSPFYWFDSEFIEIIFAITALCLFDLWDRRCGKLPQLAVFAIAGGLVGWGVQQLLTQTGLMEPFLRAIVHPQGDLTAINPKTGELFAAADMITNWPRVFYDFSPWMGLVAGVVAGLSVYFYRYGAWRSGSSLLVHITVGSFLVFLIGPVLLSNVFKNYGGFRLTPPRGDSWANILGCMIGALVYFHKNQRKSLIFATLSSGMIGGLGLMTALFVRSLCWTPGNPALTDDAAVIEAWRHWRSANWHSIMTEQFAGVLYGLAIAIPLGLLATRTKPFSGEQRLRRWTEIFAVFFVFNVLTYINIFKNVDVWTSGRAGGPGAMPEMMKAPLFGSIELSASAWFNLAYLAFSACTVFLLVAHQRKRLAIFPESWLGKGQLLYLAFLWMMVIANFERALTGFQEQRLATEGGVFFNGLVCMVLLLFCARKEDETPPIVEADSCALIRKTIALTVAGWLLFATVYLGTTRCIYGDNRTGFGGGNFRFGPDADWRVKPLLRTGKHN